jgi:hypothetical protein
MGGGPWLPSPAFGSGGTLGVVVVGGVGGGGGGAGAGLQVVVPGLSGGVEGLVEGAVGPGFEELCPGALEEEALAWLAGALAAVFAPGAVVTWSGEPPALVVPLAIGLGGLLATGAPQAEMLIV